MSDPSDLPEPTPVETTPVETTPVSASHLAAERLAALADETPSLAETTHLAACAVCRGERQAYVALLDLARASATEEPAEDRERSATVTAGQAADADPAWTAIAASLRAEGLVGEGRRAAAVDARARRRRTLRARVARAWGGAISGAAFTGSASRVAAGLLLAAGAAIGGRWSATRGPWAVAALDTAGAPAAVAPASPEAARAALARARAEYVRAAAVLAAAEPAGDPSGDEFGGLGPGLANPPVVASAGTPGVGASNATAVVRRDPPTAQLLRARVAALDAVLPGVQAAAREAPQDPAVNHVYLTAYDAREAALRQLGRSLPAGARISGY